MWNIQISERCERCLKEYRKKYPNETTAVLNNLDTYFSALNKNIKSRQIKAGFMHIEPKGVIAIDQKGGKGRLKQSRLYIYSDEKEKILHLIILGDKNSQQKDIKFCNDFIKNLRNIKNA